MDTPILDRPHVTNLLGVEDIVQAIDCLNPNPVVNIVHDFCQRNSFSEIVIQHDGDKLGLILDAYDGEDNVDTAIIMFDDWNHYLLAVVNPITKECLFWDERRDQHRIIFGTLDEWYGVKSKEDASYDLHFFYEEEFEFSIYHNGHYDKHDKDVVVKVVYDEKSMNDYKFLNLKYHG